ncbi:MAG TPA: hypothetical protein VMV69_00260 [Pirellulales bacterium]|nr:hypothetical protein [Pirellulales bacterium]
MYASRLTAVFSVWLMASVAPCRLGGAVDVASQALVDEVIAGTEANLALIEHGTATYSVRRTNVVPAGLDVPGDVKIAHGTYTKEGEVRVSFDYPRMHFEWRGTGRVPGEVATERAIYDGEYNMRFLVPSAGAGTGTVFIMAGSHSTTGNYLHPRKQFRGFWIRPPSFADQLRGMAAADASLTAARQPDGLVRFANQPTAGKIRGIYWISPNEGYSLVRAQEWPVWSPVKPPQLYEATARPAGNGAFVLAHRLARFYSLSKSGELEPSREEESTLREIDLRVRPDPKLFTIDGLGLRVGARIDDQVHGRLYHYGIDAGGESGILLPRSGGPMTLRYWFIGLNGLAGMLAIGWMIYRAKRGRPGPAI